MNDKHIQDTDDQIRAVVREGYARAAEAGSTPEQRAHAERVGYSADELAGAPEEANLGLGCVSVADFAHGVGFLNCFSGPNKAPRFVPPSAKCLRINDADNDGDVDLTDLTGPDGFLRNMTGPRGSAGCP